MDPDDIFDRVTEPEVAIGAAALAVILSPPVRRVVRQSAVLGMTGLVMAGDAVARVTRRLDLGIRRPPDASFAQTLVDEARSERAQQAQSAARVAPSPHPATQVEANGASS